MAKENRFEERVQAFMKYGQVTRVVVQDGRRVSPRWSVNDKMRVEVTLVLCLEHPTFHSPFIVLIGYVSLHVAHMVDPFSFSNDKSRDVP